MLFDKQKQNKKTSIFMLLCTFFLFFIAEPIYFFAILIFHFGVDHWFKFNPQKKHKKDSSTNTHYLFV